MNLFEDIPEQLSPREAWVRKHGVRVEEGETGFCAMCAVYPIRATAETRDDALNALAWKLNSKHGIEGWWQ